MQKSFFRLPKSGIGLVWPTGGEKKEILTQRERKIQMLRAEILCQFHSTFNYQEKSDNIRQENVLFDIFISNSAFPNKAVACQSLKVQTLESVHSNESDIKLKCHTNF